MSQAPNEFQVQEAQIELTQATIEITPDTQVGQTVKAVVPDWILLVCIIIGALFLLAGAIRFTPFGKWWKLFWNTWHKVAGDE